MSDISLLIALRKWCQLLETYNGRDKVLRISAFICTLMSDFPGLRHSPLAAKFRIAGKQISASRTVQRLLDDLPTLNRTVSYRLGEGEKDWIIRLSMLTSQLINTLYSPVETMAWAGDHKIIGINTAPLTKLLCYGFAANMYLVIVRTVRTISHLIQQKQRLTETEKNSEKDISQFYRRLYSELLNLIQQSSDFGVAVNNIPGLLWGGKLKPCHIGLLGIISSFISINKLLQLVP